MANQFSGRTLWQISLLAGLNGKSFFWQDIMANQFSGRTLWQISLLVRLYGKSVFWQNFMANQFCTYFKMTAQVMTGVWMRVVGWGVGVGEFAGQLMDRLRQSTFSAFHWY